MIVRIVCFFFGCFHMIQQSFHKTYFFKTNFENKLDYKKVCVQYFQKILFGKSKHDFCKGGRKNYAGVCNTDARRKFI